MLNYENIIIDLHRLGQRGSYISRFEDAVGSDSDALIPGYQTVRRQWVTAVAASLFPFVGRGVTE